MGLEGNDEETFDDLKKPQAILAEVFEEIDKDSKSRNPYNNKIIPGFEKLDQILLGFREGDLNIIASRPAIGKTTFAISIFLNIVAQNINALYISFEKYEKDLLKNILSIKSKVNSLNLESGFLSSGDYKRLADTTEKIYNNNSMFIKTFYNTDLIKLRDFIKEKIKIVFIDYLSLIIPAPTYANRWEQVSEISRSLKAMAMEFKIPFVVLCPIHRNIADNNPEITDLSESGSIEYEADRVILLYKTPDKKKENEDFDVIDRDKKRITVYIAKNRRGPTAVINLLFDYKNKTIEEISNFKQ